MLDPQRLSHRIIAGILASALVLGFAAATDDGGEPGAADADLTVEIADHVDLD
jgi:hypothetical protein